MAIAFTDANMCATSMAQRNFLIKFNLLVCEQTLS